MAKSFYVDIELHGKDKGAGSTVDKMAQKLKMLRKESRASGEAGFEKALARDPAEALGQLAGLGKLGVAGVVMDKLAEGVNRVTEAAKGIREGKKNFADLGIEAIGAVPFVGQLAVAIAKMGYELSGAAGEQDKLARKMEAGSRVDSERSKRILQLDRKSTRLNSSHSDRSRMPSSA